MLFLLVIVTLIACSSPVVEGAINEAQLKGIEKLVRGNFTRGIYATCNIILFEEKVDFETAESNCKHFDVDYTNSECLKTGIDFLGGDLGEDVAGINYRDLSIYGTLGACLRACISIPSLCKAFTWVGPAANVTSEFYGCHLKHASGWTIEDQVDMYSMEMSCYNTLTAEASAMFSTGSLVTIDDEEKNHDIKYLFGLAYKKTDKTWAADQWVWSGLRKVRNNFGNSYTDVYNVNDWEWSSGDIPTSFENWQAKMPDQKQKIKDGILYYQNQMRINHDGKWDDTFIYKVHPYACDYKGKYIISPVRRTWVKAREACEEAGLTLAMVKSQYDVDELETLINYILGPRDTSLKKFNNRNWIWVGGNDLNHEGTWLWPDGEEVKKFAGFSWETVNPDNAEYIGDTGQDVLAFSKWGSFDDSFSDSRKRAFACQCPDS